MEIYQFYDHINILIKPTNSCNLRCIYCFHQDYGYDSTFLKDETLSQFLEITFPHYKSVSIIWHGGEPTFVGEEIFERYVEIAESYADRYQVQLNQTMQTNGTLLNQKFLDIIKKHNIGFGISYDGPINDITRNSTTKLLKNMELIKKNDLNFGVITVISGININNLRELYYQMKKLNCTLQMNYYVDTSKASPVELLITPKQYLDAMKNLFEIWIYDEDCNIYVDPFMRMISDIYKGFSTLCARSSCLRNWLCLNPDGELTPCDRDFPDEYSYGFVSDYDDIRKIYNSKGFNLLIKKSVVRRDKCKEECDVYALCRGGCNNNALFESGLESNGGFSCIVTKELIRYIRKRIVDLNLFDKPELILNPILRKSVKKLKLFDSKI